MSRLCRSTSSPIVHRLKIKQQKKFGHQKLITSSINYRRRSRNLLQINQAMARNDSVRNPTDASRRRPLSNWVARLSVTNWKIKDSWAVRSDRKRQKCCSTHTKLSGLISLDHQINHRCAIQLIMIAVQLDVRVHAGTVVLRVLVVLVEISHLER